MSYPKTENQNGPSSTAAPKVTHTWYAPKEKAHAHEWKQHNKYHKRSPSKVTTWSITGQTESKEVCCDGCQHGMQCLANLLLTTFRQTRVRGQSHQNWAHKAMPGKSSTDYIYVTECIVYVFRAMTLYPFFPVLFLFDWVGFFYGPII